MSQWQRRLPRSNAPHPQESLAGYLLNLAHRLELTPADLIRRTGLKTGKSIGLLDLQYGITLPEQTRKHFTATTGLSTDEAIALTYDRYARALFEPDEHGNIARTRHGNLWVALGRTRYCPQCLHAPDSAAPTQALWKIDWLTPWAVACATHGSLLQDTCPDCRTPVGEPGRGFRSLVPNLAYPVDHPAACRAAPRPGRTALCHSRLDIADSPAAEPELLALQERFNAVLDHQNPPSHSLGAPIKALQWLRDIRAVTVLVQLARDTSTFDGVPYGDHAAEFVFNRVPNASAGDTANRTVTQPPSDTKAAAGLYLAADRLLNDPDQVAYVNNLARQAKAQEQQLTKRFITSAPMSDRLNHAVRDIKSRIADPRKVRAYTGDSTYTFGPEHLPAYLDEPTYQRHFPDVPEGRYPRPIRRFVPIALARLVSSLTTVQAGSTLGYDESRTSAACARASDAFDTIGHDQLRKRIVDIAAEIEAGPRVDYRHRRTQLTSDWNIDDDLWLAFRTALLDARLARSDTPWPRRRIVYTAWVWAIATGGDISTAPMIQRRLAGRACTDGITSDFQALYRRVPPEHHQLVHDLATQVALRVDAQAR